jgi:hypothetical protein
LPLPVKEVEASIATSESAVTVAEPESEELPANSK